MKMNEVLMRPLAIYDYEKDITIRCSMVLSIFRISKSKCIYAEMLAICDIAIQFLLN